MEQHALDDGIPGAESSRGNGLSPVVIIGGSMSASEAMRRQIYGASGVEDIHRQGFVDRIRGLLFSRPANKASTQNEPEYTSSSRLTPLPLMRSITSCPYQPGMKSSPHIGVAISPQEDKSVSIASVDFMADQPSVESSPQMNVVPLSPKDGSVPLPLVESTSNGSRQLGTGSSPTDFIAHDFAFRPPSSLKDAVGRAIGEGSSKHTIHTQSPPSEPDSPTTELQIVPTALQAENSADSKRREQEALIRKFEDYKLETEFSDSYIVHTIYNWDLSTRVWEKSTWRKERVIGRGAFGKVWLQKEQEGQLRAVKVLSRNPLPTAGPSQELLALVKLRDYDHLFVKFLGWYENGKKTFLAMEYIEYGDLGGYMLTQEAQEVKSCVQEITRQILQGLEVLHEKEISHRDLKPQNILVASLDPIWVKITDFGISKRAKKTFLRTMMCGTDGYIAPELLGLLRRDSRQEFLGPALDIWSLGSLVHKLLTSQTPFADPYDESDSESGVIGLPLQCGTDKVMLRDYCDGVIEFPTEALRESCVSERGIAFVKSLLNSDPKERPTAAIALQNPWLKGNIYKSRWFEDLRSEFSSLGVNLDPNDILVRQARKIGVLLLLRIPKESVPSLLLEAAARQHNFAISELLESSNRESIDPLTSGKLFELAAKTGNLNTIKILLHNKINVGARIDGQTVLEWAASIGHLDTVTLLESSNGTTYTKRMKALLLAIKSRHMNVVRMLLRNQAEINTYGSDSQTILQMAAGDGNIDTVRFLLDSGADVNSKARGKGRTALQAAVKGGHIDIVKLLLDNKAEVNAAAADSNGRTALQEAAGCGHTDIVKFLLENKAEMNAGNGRIALQEAAGGGHIDIVKLLLDNKAEVNAAAEYYSGQTALQAAAGGGHFDIVKLLLDNKAEVNTAGDGNGRTALQAAAGGGHIDIVKLLLDNKAEVNAAAEDYSGRTALQAAAGEGHMDIIKLLLDNKAEVNTAAAHFSGRTALQAAAGEGHIDIVKLLLDNKAEVNAAAAHRNGRTALQAAAGGGHFDIVKLLLDNKAEVNARRSFGDQTALQGAAGGGHFDIVKLLLDNKAEVNAAAEYYSGQTALQAAAGEGHIDIVKLLLDNKAEVNAGGGIDDQKALQAAAGGGHFDIVKLLLDNKAEVNTAGDGNGRTALQAAAGGGHFDIVKLLLDNKAEVNARGGFGDLTALQAAAGGGHFDIVKLLLDNKAEVNASGVFVQAALQAAAGGGYFDIVKLLLDNKAEVNAGGVFGDRTALKAAAGGGYFDIVKLLLDNKAKVNTGRGFGDGTALQAAAGGGYFDIIKLLLDNGADINGCSGEALERVKRSGIPELVRIFSGEIVLDT